MKLRLSLLVASIGAVQAFAFNAKSKSSGAVKTFRAGQQANVVPMKSRGLVSSDNGNYNGVIDDWLILCMYLLQADLIDSWID